MTFENGLTGLNSTLELAKPASEIRVNENNLAGEIGTALKLPVKVHLENPFLGCGCYVGSSSSPLIWNLTTGTTSPPEPNKPITGTAATIEFLEEGRILESKGANLVDNAWSAPGASGCGGFLVELILDPIINAAAGVPAAAGHNTAILNNTILTSPRLRRCAKTTKKTPRLYLGTLRYPKHRGESPGAWAFPKAVTRK